MCSNWSLGPATQHFLRSSSQWRTYQRFIPRGSNWQIAQGLTAQNFLLKLIPMQSNFLIQKLISILLSFTDEIWDIFYHAFSPTDHIKKEVSRHSSNQSWLEFPCLPWSLICESSMLSAFILLFNWPTSCAAKIKHKKKYLSPNRQGWYVDGRLWVGHGAASEGCRMPWRPHSTIPATL